MPLIHFSIQCRRRQQNKMVWLGIGCLVIICLGNERNDLLMNMFYTTMDTQRTVMTVYVTSYVQYYCIKIIHNPFCSQRLWCVASSLPWSYSYTGDPLHSRALAHSRAPLFTQPCPHCSHSRAPGEQWARLCAFTLQGCVQAARLCRGSPVS